jgi:hypothetical protein
VRRAFPSIYTLGGLLVPIGAAIGGAVPTATIIVITPAMPRGKKL